jgi:hypothetical protein
MNKYNSQEKDHALANCRSSNAHQRTNRPQKKLATGASSVAGQREPLLAVGNG